MKFVNNLDRGVANEQMRECMGREHLQYVAFYWLTKDWPTHCGMMVLHLVLGMLEKLVDDSLGIRDMVNHAANDNRKTRQWVGFDSAEGHMNNICSVHDSCALFTYKVLRRIW